MHVDKPSPITDVEGLWTVDVGARQRGCRTASCFRRRMLYRFLAERAVRLGKCLVTISDQFRPVRATCWSNLSSFVAMMSWIPRKKRGWPVWNREGSLFTYLGRRPGALVNARIKAIPPSLEDLVAISRAHRLGDLAPAESVLFHGVEQFCVLLLAPGALADGVGEAVAPPLAAVFVVAAGEMGCDFVPADGAGAGRL